jgi:hypothetical protein
MICIYIFVTCCSLNTYFLCSQYILYVFKSQKKNSNSNSDQLAGNYFFVVFWLLELESCIMLY